MGIEEDTLGMNGRNGKRGGLSDGKRMYVGKKKVQLNPAIAHLKGPPIFIRYSGVTLLPGLNLPIVH